METEEKRLDLNIELAVTPEKGVYIHKCVTNDWPAKLLLEVMGVVDEKIRAYYCNKEKDAESSRGSIIPC